MIEYLLGEALGGWLERRRRRRHDRVMEKLTGKKVDPRRTFVQSKIDLGDNAPDKSQRG